MTNKMEVFNQAAALILGKLYDEFPIPIHLHISELKDAMTDEEAVIFASTLQFLMNEGFVRCGNTVGQGMLVSNVNLTSRGLDVLNSKPEVFNGKITLGDKIKEVAKGGTKEVIGTAIKAVIGAVVKSSI